LTEQKINACLWFNNQAEEAANFYASVFPNSRVLDAMRGPDGNAITVEFEVQGQRFVGLNGGPEFTFSEAISFMVHCDTQDEVDQYWEKLTSDGGEESMCGWLKDKFGVSWQIIPRELTNYLGDPNPERAQRAMQAMLQMRKIDINEIKRAADAA